MKHGVHLGNDDSHESQQHPEEESVIGTSQSHGLFQWFAHLQISSAFNEDNWTCFWLHLIKHPTSSPPRRGRVALFKLPEQDLFLKNNEPWLLDDSDSPVHHWAFISGSGWMVEWSFHVWVYVCGQRKEREITPLPCRLRAEWSSGLNSSCLPQNSPAFLYFLTHTHIQSHTLPSQRWQHFTKEPLKGLLQFKSWKVCLILVRVH